MKNSRDHNILMEAIAYESRIPEGPKVVSFLLDKAIVLLSEEEFFQLLYEEEHWKIYSGFYMPVERIAIFEAVWRVAKKKLEGENLKTLVTNKLFFHILIHFIEIKELIFLWNFIQSNTDENAQRDLIMHEHWEQSLIEVSLSNDDKDVSNMIFDITESFLLIDDRKVIDFIRDKGFLKEFILKTCVWSSKFLKKFSSKIQKVEFRDIFLSKTMAGRNIFHCLVESKNLDETVKVWNLIVSNFISTEKVGELLFESTYFLGNNWNVFEYAAFLNNRFYDEMYRWCCKNFNHKTMKKIAPKRDYPTQKATTYWRKYSPTGITYRHTIATSVARGFVEYERTEMVIVPEKGFFNVTSSGMSLERLKEY